MAAADLLMAKTALREHVRARLRQMSAEERAAGSAQACALRQGQRLWQQARCILGYAPTEVELDLWPVLRAALASGKTVTLPRFDPLTDTYVVCRIDAPEQDLTPGKFGIREPVERCGRVPLNRLDFLLVPGLAFDPHGRRLGRGKGYYDRLLAGRHGPTCGVAYDQQIVPAVPVGPHDIHLNCILTPTRWIEL